MKSLLILVGAVLVLALAFGCVLETPDQVTYLNQSYIPTNETVNSTANLNLVMNSSTLSLYTPKTGDAGVIYVSIDEGSTAVKYVKGVPANTSATTAPAKAKE